MVILKKRGLALMELIWIVFFILGFLSSFTYFYDQSQKHIEKHRMGKMVQHDHANIFVH